VKTALIYLRMETSVMTGDCLQRLHVLRGFALDAGYEISEVWPVHSTPEGRRHRTQWSNARLDLAARRFNAIVFWDDTRDAPATFTLPEGS
jgi:hypothetical protein